MKIQRFYGVFRWCPSISSMYVIALNNIARNIEDNEDTPKEDELLLKVYALESENRKLKSKLEEIKKII